MVEDSGWVALIMESDHIQRDLIMLALRRSGFQPVVCQNVDDLPDELEKLHPALLLLGTNLPGHNGIELLQQLRKDGRLPQTRVIMLSSLGFPEIVRQAVKAGADEFLVKPIDPEALISRARKLVGHGE